MLLSNRSPPPLIISSWIKLPCERDKQGIEKYWYFFFFLRYLDKPVLVVRRSNEGSMCVCVCLFCLTIFRTEGDREMYLGWFLSQWSSGDSCSVCRLHSQPLLPFLLSFTFVLDPIQILSHSSSYYSQSLSLPHITIFSIHYPLPSSSSVCLPIWLLSSCAFFLFFVHLISLVCFAFQSALLPPSLHPFFLDSVYPHLKGEV